MRSSAMSVPGSEPTNCALKTRRSFSRTTISCASLTTWWLVITSPRAASTMTPEPALRSRRCGWSGRSKKRRKNGSRIIGFASCERDRVAMFTTAGVTFSSIGASEGSGWPSTASGSAAKAAEAAASAATARSFEDRAHLAGDSSRRGRPACRCPGRRRGRRSRRARARRPRRAAARVRPASPVSAASAGPKRPAKPTGWPRSPA